MCYNCGTPVWQPCNCNKPKSCCPPDPSGCPVKLDFSCVIYHQNNNELSKLTGLGLNNGATLEQFAEAVDVKIAQLNVPDWTLPFLRNAPNSYTINTLKQFGEAVDTELADLQAQIDALSLSAAVPITPVDSPTINLTASGTLNHTVRADVTFSAIADNQAEALSDGVYVGPQTLSINVGDKTLTISDGNTVDLTSITCGVGGFLGNFTADPLATDGQYWFRTDLSASIGLRIRLNGSVRTITTS